MIPEKDDEPRHGGGVQKGIPILSKTGSGDPDAEFSVQPDDEQDRTDGKGGKDFRTPTEGKTGGETGA